MGKFKVGDRVRVTRDAGYTGTIKGRSSDEYRNEPAYAVNMDWYSNPETTTTWYESELEPVAESQQPQPLRIEAGKFYITRDGRKVGPMRRWSDEARHRWEADDDELPYIWADDGTEIDSDIDDGADLVAEVDEPGRDNGSAGYGSTAGFTVPLCAYDDEPGWYVTELGRAYADGYAAGLRAAA